MTTVRSHEGVMPQEDGQAMEQRIVEDEDAPSDAAKDAPTALGQEDEIAANDASNGNEDAANVEENDKADGVFLKCQGVWRSVQQQVDDIFSDVARRCVLCIYSTHFHVFRNQKE